MAARAIMTTAVVLHGARDLRVEHRFLARPDMNDVTVKILATGLCGSDLHYYADGRNGDFAVRTPLVLGHEAAGIITAVGADVFDLKVGQRVAIEAGISCRNCTYCARGRYNLCKGMRFASSASRFPHLDGTLRTAMNHPAWVCHPIPDDVPLELAALAEPLSVLIHAGRRVALGSLPNETVLVFGVGAIGLIACALARHRGARRVVAVDINAQRLAFARREGFADAVYCLPSPSSSSSGPPPMVVDACCAHPLSEPHPPRPAPGLSAADARAAMEAPLLAAQATVTTLLTYFGQLDGFDVVFECTGAESAIQMSVYAAAAGGRAMLVGMGSRNVYMPVSAAAVREVDVKGSFRYAGTYEEALQLLRPSSEEDEESAEVQEDSAEPQPRRSLAAQVAKLVTHRVLLEDTQRAFEMLARGTDDAGGLVLKVIVGPAETESKDEENAEDAEEGKGKDTA